MSVTVKKGNIFTTKCQTLVNTVNCVGVMGAGIALECRLRYPDMYQRYVALCKEKKFDIGKLWVWEDESHDKLVLNFPTKRDWKYPSRPEYLHKGLEKFRQTYAKRGITSIAFPLLGADKGGISKDVSKKIMHEYLDDLPIDVEIYEYDPSCEDDLYLLTKSRLRAYEPPEIAEETGIRIDRVKKLIEALENPGIVQLNQVARVKGIGIDTLEKIFRFASNAHSDLLEPKQEPLAL